MIKVHTTNPVLELGILLEWNCGYLLFIDRKSWSII